PADIRSFIMSYRPATEWKTSATLPAFSRSGTDEKPKWVLVSPLSRSEADEEGISVFCMICLSYIILVEPQATEHAPANGTPNMFLAPACPGSGHDVIQGKRR